jgi:hypothetical protein
LLGVFHLRDDLPAATQLGVVVGANTANLGDEGVAELTEESGEPGRTRTYNPLLKRQLLYH